VSSGSRGRSPHQLQPNQYAAQFQTLREIVNAPGGEMVFHRAVEMKSKGKPGFRFRLALAGGRVFTLTKNKSARSL
jgi:hypothetical protein